MQGSVRGQNQTEGARPPPQQIQCNFTTPKLLTDWPFRVYFAQTFLLSCCSNCITYLFHELNSVISNYSEILS